MNESGYPSGMTEHTTRYATRIEIYEATWCATDDTPWVTAWNAIYSETWDVTERATAETIIDAIRGVVKYD